MYSLENNALLLLAAANCTLPADNFVAGAEENGIRLFRLIAASGAQLDHTVVAVQKLHIDSCLKQVHSIS